MYRNQINTQQICLVRANVHEEHLRYKYREALTFFGFTLREAGFYNNRTSIFWETMSKEEIEENDKLICIGKQVFYKPYLEICPSNKSEHTLFFETEQEMKGYLQTEPFRHINWLHGEEIG